MKLTALGLIAAGMCMVGFAMGAGTNAPRVRFSPGNPVHQDIPQAVGQVLEALAALPLREVNLVQADRKAVLVYIEGLVQGGMLKRILHPLIGDTPRHETEAMITLRLVDTTYLAALCRISREAGFKFGITCDGTLVLVDANDPLSSTDVYYVVLKDQQAKVAQYEVLLPRK